MHACIYFPTGFLPHPNTCAILTIIPDHCYIIFLFKYLWTSRKYIYRFKAQEYDIHFHSLNANP